MTRRRFFDGGDFARGRNADGFIAAVCLQNGDIGESVQHEQDGDPAGQPFSHLIKLFGRVVFHALVQFVANEQPFVVSKLPFIAFEFHSTSSFDQTSSGKTQKPRQTHRSRIVRREVVYGGVCGTRPAAVALKSRIAERHAGFETIARLIRAGKAVVAVELEHSVLRQTALVGVLQINGVSCVRFILSHEQSGRAQQHDCRWRRAVRRCTAVFDPNLRDAVPRYRPDAARRLVNDDHKFGGCDKAKRERSPVCAEYQAARVRYFLRFERTQRIYNSGHANFAGIQDDRRWSRYR